MNNVSNFTTCISLENQSCMTRTTLIDLNPDEYNHGLRYYPFIVNVDRCNVICNTFDYPSGRIFFPNKTENVHINVFEFLNLTCQKDYV